VGLRSAATSALVSRTNLTKGRYHITRNVIKVISGCQEPSWLENIELCAKKAIKRENVGQ
jgi:hypothetical protein